MDMLLLVEVVIIAGPVALVITVDTVIQVAAVEYAAQNRHLPIH